MRLWVQRRLVFVTIPIGDGICAILRNLVVRKLVNCIHHWKEHEKLSYIGWIRVRLRWYTNRVLSRDRFWFNMSTFFDGVTLPLIANWIWPKCIYRMQNYKRNLRSDSKFAVSWHLDTVSVLGKWYNHGTWIFKGVYDVEKLKFLENACLRYCRQCDCTSNDTLFILTPFV